MRQMNAVQVTSYFARCMFLNHASDRDLLYSVPQIMPQRTDRNYRVVGLRGFGQTSATRRPEYRLQVLTVHRWLCSCQHGRRWRFVRQYGGNTHTNTRICRY